MFELIKKIFIALLSFSRSIVSIGNVSDHTKSVYLNNQPFMNQPTLINLHPTEYIQRLYYHPFAVNLNRYSGSYNTMNYKSSRMFVPNKTDVNLSIFKIIIGINE